MSLPISDIMRAGLLCLALAACGDQPPEGGNTAALGGAQARAEPDDGKVECAIGRGADWRRDCLAERSEGEDGAMLTLRHPDGGFRRFNVLTNGRGLASADGAERARIVLLGDRRIEVTVGEDRYRLPVTLGSANR